MCLTPKPHHRFSGKIGLRMKGKSRYLSKINEKHPKSTPMWLVSIRKPAPKRDFSGFYCSDNFSFAWWPFQSFHCKAGLFQRSFNHSFGTECYKNAFMV